MNATYGTLAIGILVMADIFAVVFFNGIDRQDSRMVCHRTVRFAVLSCPLFYKVLDWVGHGEMLVLFGIFFALVVGAGLFQFVGVKPDLAPLS